jgi:uncharacterized protein (DUF2267 family)
MTAAALDVFQTTLSKTNHWLNDLAKELAWQDRHTAYVALRATLHALRDRLSVAEAVQLGAQLPMLIRGFYYEDWVPSGKPLKERHKEQFLAHIKHACGRADMPDPEQVAWAVFRVLAKRISTGEIEDVRHMLPAEVRELWP